MIIEKLVYNIERRFDIYKHKQEQKFINNFVQIHGNTNESEALKEIYKARKIIANYISDDGIAVDFYAPAKEKEQNLTIKLTNLFTNKSSSKTVPADVNKKFIRTEDDYFVIDYKDEGTQLVRKTKHEYEDNFIRHIFRQIVDLKKNLKNNY